MTEFDWQIQGWWEKYGQPKLAAEIAPLVKRIEDLEGKLGCLGGKLVSLAPETVCSADVEWDSREFVGGD